MINKNLSIEDHIIDAQYLTERNFIKHADKMNNYFSDNDFSKKNPLVISIMALSSNLIFAQTVHLQSMQNTQDLLCDITKSLEDFVELYDIYAGSSEEIAKAISDINVTIGGKNERG